MMKRHLTKLVVLFLAVGLAFNTADAQTKKKTTSKQTPKKTTAPVTAVVDEKPAADTTPAAKPPAPAAAEKQNVWATDTPRTSLRGDAAIERNLVKDRVPLAYEHIREDDAWFRERVWREIDIREKMNLPFRYRAQEDNGSQRFISILLNGLRTGDITAFDATIDDRFTTPLTIEQIGKNLAGRCDTIEVPDFEKDPTGSKGLMKSKAVCAEFNPDDIQKFRVKEEWVFDKESSRLYSRILGIAPVKTIVDENTGQVLGETPLFWLYYPDLRPTLAKYEVYNGKNFGARMSWEELFESRYFSSYIVKSTFENPQDLFIKGYIKDDILKLLEGDAIKDKIFNFEQDLWQY